MESFDTIDVRRPELAKSYLAQLSAQPGRPIALFAPRRVGKTFFLENDIDPAARRTGLQPVYVDLWLHRSEPLTAINHALEEALDDLLVPKSTLSRRAKTTVTKVGALGASIEFGKEPARRELPTEPALRFDALVQRVAKRAGKPILLLLDEAQTLGEHVQSTALLGTLRAVLHKRRTSVRAILTGSSQDALAAMMSTTGAPMYQFAQLSVFPTLGDEYLELLAKHFVYVHPKRTLDLPALRRVFDRLGHRPALMKDIVKEMSAEGSTDVEAAIERLVKQDRLVAGWTALLDSLDGLARDVLTAIAFGAAPFAQDTRRELARSHPGVTLAKVRSAVDRLRRRGLLSPQTGGYVLDDPRLVEHLTRRGLLPGEVKS